MRINFQLQFHVIIEINIHQINYSFIIVYFFNKFKNDILGVSTETYKMQNMTTPTILLCALP